MKEIRILSMLLLVFTTTLFVSCGDDDSDESSSIVTDNELINKAVGVWMCTQSTDTQQGNSYQGLMVGKEITILANGTYTSTAPSFGYSGTYSVSGNKITAHSDAGGTFVITVTFKGSQMEWQGTANNGVSFVYIFERENVEMPQALSFTKELLVGNEECYCWHVESVSIERGSSGNISTGKTINFNEDGTCTAFHSMETAWRINNGKVETYNKNTNEPIYVYTLLSDDGNKINVRINGTLDDDLQASLIMSRLRYEILLPDEYYDFESVYAQIYASCASFVDAQLKLESIRTNPNTVHSIFATSSEISGTFQKVYRAINYANLYLEKIGSAGTIPGFDKDKSIAEVRALRAFTYYNLAMLWGDVPFITKSIIDDLTTPIPQTGQAEVYQFAYKEICEVISNLPQTNKTDDITKFYFNQDAGRMFKAAMALTLGDKNTAKNTLDEISKSQYGTETRSTVTSLSRQIIWALYKSETEYIPVYTFAHNQLFYYEINGSRNGLDLGYYNESVGVEGESENLEGDIVSEWQRQQNVDYGYWPMLKRLGKAQEVTGCYDYELLMPFPISEVKVNSSLKQNPGY